jgi:hypothetical protein
VDLLAFGAAFVASALLGFVKGPLGKADNAIVNALKPVQPLVVGIAALGVPYLAGVLGLREVPDVATFVSAPTATVLAVTFREVLARLRK